MTPPPSSAARRRAIVVTLRAAVLASGLAACEPTAPTAPTVGPWPPGTVLALNDVPIRADEVDAAGSMVAVVEPSYTLEHLRRLALTNVVLPRLAGVRAAGEARTRARALADECHALLAAGTSTVAPLEGVVLHERDGGYGDVGMECFDYAVSAPLGRWSPVTETIGAFEMFRVEERSAADAPREMRVRVTACVVPYLDPAESRTLIDAQLDRSRIVYVDEAWRDVVPEIWKHRLRGGVP